MCNISYAKKGSRRLIAGQENQLHSLPEHIYLDLTNEGDFFIEEDIYPNHELFFHYDSVTFAILHYFK